MAQAIYLATGNAHKLAEMAGMLAACQDIELRSAADLGGMPAVAEEAPDFAGNARLKAEALLPLVPEGAWVLADDSGLEVNALGGAPGVHSARYAGPSATPQENNDKLLKALDGIPQRQRGARFVSVFCLCMPAAHFFRGECHGSISRESDGLAGFGYDPLFVPDGFTETFAALGQEVKNRISHRARAVRQLADYLVGASIDLP